MKRLVAVFTTFFLMGCSSGGTPVKETPNVVVSIPPYTSLVKAIVGNTMTVDSALGANFDPHTAEVTPSQMKMVQNADLFIGIGEEYEGKLLSAIREGTKEVRILEMDERIPLLSYSQDTNFVDACQDINLPLGGSKDLHIWLGPKRLIPQVQVMIEVLSQIKPHNQSIYEHNGEVLIERIKDLDRRLYEKLRPFEKRAIIVSHASLGYFCYDYNLIQIAVECEGKSPLPQNVSRVYDLARHSDVICAFTASQFNNKGAELVAKELKLRVIPFDPLSEDILETLQEIGNMIAQ